MPQETLVGAGARIYRSTGSITNSMIPRALPNAQTKLRAEILTKARLAFAAVLTILLLESTLESSWSE